jgi:CRP-like cAMP-binding protein
MNLIVSKLNTRYSTPEVVIFYQGDDSSDGMYFISGGDCAVNVIDEIRKIHIAYKLLVEGDHFGEVGVVYDCCRTATIVSRNYNTMANLTI